MPPKKKQKSSQEGGQQAGSNRGRGRARGRAGNARRVGAAGGGKRGRGRAVAQKPARPNPREATCLAAAAAAKATVTGWTPATPTTTAAVLKAQAVVYAAAETSPAQQTESVWEFSPPKETASEFSAGVLCFFLAIVGEELTHATVRAGVRGAADSWSTSPCSGTCRLRGCRHGLGLPAGRCAPPPAAAELAAATQVRQQMRGLREDVGPAVCAGGGDSRRRGCGGLRRRRRERDGVLPSPPLPLPSQTSRRCPPLPFFLPR